MHREMQARRRLRPLPLPARVQVQHPMVVSRMQTAAWLPTVPLWIPRWHAWRLVALTINSKRESVGG